MNTIAVRISRARADIKNTVDKLNRIAPDRASYRKLVARLAEDKANLESLQCEAASYENYRAA